MLQGIFDFTQCPAADAGRQGTVQTQQLCAPWRHAVLPQTLTQHRAVLQQKQAVKQPPALLVRLGLAKPAFDAAALAAEADALAAQCDAALGIPADAVQMDILCRSWLPSDADIAVLVQLGDYINLPMRVWAQQDALYIAWQDAVYALPLADIGPAQKIDQKLLLPNWHKPQPANDPIWKEYRLALSVGGVYVQPYYQFAIGGGQPVLRIPAYELSTLLVLLGRSEVSTQ